MAKAAKKKVTKKRAENYEPKVSFDGTFEEMIGISVKDDEKKIEEKKAAIKDCIMYNFRVNYLIYSNGAIVGQGANTTQSTDPKNDGRDALKNAVLAELRKKYSTRNFSITISHSKQISKDEANGLENGWTMES